MQGLLFLLTFAWSVSAVCADDSSARFAEPAAAYETIVSLMRDRLAQMPSVAAVKWIAHAQVDDPAREVQVLDRVAARAEQLGLDVPATRTLFEIQIRLARELQARLHRDWARSGHCAPCDATSELTGLRERIDAINDTLLSALYLAASLPPLTPDEHSHALTVADADARWAGLLPTATDRQALFDAVQNVRLTTTRRADWERIQASAVLRIGTTGDYAPFSTVESDGTLRGADIALALDLARRLQLRPVFIRIAWPTLTQDLRDDRFDVALSGISYTPERASLGLFSTPYHHGGKTILARCVERERFDTLAEVDQPGVRVIVNPGGTNERYVRSTLHRATIVVHRDNPTTFVELIAGNADAMITDDIEAELQSRRHSELCRTSPGTLTEGDKHVLVARDDRLLAAVNSWLAAATAAGLPRRWLQQAMTEESASSPSR